MSDFDKHSRLNKYEKRRKTTKSITLLIIIAIILLLILIGTIIFGGDKKVDEKVSKSTEPANTEVKIEDKEPKDSDEEETSEPEENASDDEEIEIEQVEPSDDNVAEAYKGDWKPVETNQEGPHTTNYSSESADRVEIKEAVVAATGLDPDDMVEWKVENGGDQKVLATVSDHDETELYRVYLSWIDSSGWQVMKIEELIENDKK